MISRVCSLLRMKQPVLADRGLLFASGATVPTDGTDGYQTGCIFQHTDGSGGTALYVNEGSVTSCDFNAVEAGDYADKLQVGTHDWGVGATGIALDGTDPDMVLQVAGRINAAVASGAYSASYDQLAVTASQTNDVSTFASWSELYFTGGTISTNGNNAAIWGNLEISGTFTGPASTSTYLGAVVGTVITPATFTNSGICGAFIADGLLTAGYTNNSIIAAFVAHVNDSHSTKANWPMGLWVNDADICIAVGTSASPVAHTTAAQRALAVYTSQAVTSGTHIGSLLQLAPLATTGTANNYTLNVRNTVATGKTCGGGQRGVYVEVEALGTGTVSGVVSAVDIETYAPNTATLGSDYYGMYIKHYTDVTPTGTNAVARLEFNGSGTLDAFLAMYGNGTSLIHGNCTVTNFLLASASGQMGCTVSADGMTANPESDQEAGYITISVQGNTYQIPFYGA